MQEFKTSDLTTAVQMQPQSPSLIEQAQSTLEKALEIRGLCADTKVYLFGPQHINDEDSKADQINSLEAIQEATREVMIDISNSLHMIKHRIGG